MWETLQVFQSCCFISVPTRCSSWNHHLTCCVLFIPSLIYGNSIFKNMKLQVINMGNRKIYTPKINNQLTFLPVMLLEHSYL